MKRRLWIVGILLLFAVFLLPDQAGAATVGSGFCGDQITWTLDDTGLLTISGTGAIYDYDYEGGPWGYAWNKITRVHIEDGITRIGSYAFADLEALDSASIPNSVTHIGTYAFNNSGLTSIDIPDSVTHIEGAAFGCCDNLTTVAIPASVVSIGPFCFGVCSELETIYFEGDAPAFGIAYDGSSVENIFSRVAADAYYPAGNTSWTADVLKDYGGFIDWAPYVQNVTICKVIPHSTGNILYWDAVVGGDIYQVYRLNGGSWELLKNTRSLGYKDETAQRGVKHYYKIVARNGDVKSDIRTTASASAVRPFSELKNVTITEAIGHSTGNIIRWNGVSGAKIYQVYRLDSGTWTLLKNTGSLAYKDETAPAGGKSYYKIVARNGDNKSDIKTTASVGVTRPAALTKLDNVTITKGIPHSTGNILYWNAVKNAKVYQVYRLRNGSWILLKNTGSLGYKDESAPAGVKSYYKIVSRNGDIKSDIKTTASFGVTRPETAIVPTDETCKESYTVNDADAIAAKNIVVARAGGEALTNGQLQVYYWMKVQQYIEAGYGPDYTQPLDAQICPLSEQGLTWQQHILKAALEEWQYYCSISQASHAVGYVMPTSVRNYLDELPATLEQKAINDGFQNANEMLAYNVGNGCEIADYLYYMETYYQGATYINSRFLAVDPTKEEMEAYFSENEQELAQEGITKDGDYVDVRSILVSPGKDSEPRDPDDIENAFTAAEWETCRQRAQAILNDWESGAATEESFAALANEISENTGYYPEGGLYEDIYEGQMIRPFEEWCFDKNRKYGDTGLVKSAYGYHIMFFVDRTPIWEVKVEEKIRNDYAVRLIAEANAAYPMVVDYRDVVLGYVDIAKWFLN